MSDAHDQLPRFVSFARRLLLPPPDQKPSEWCEQNVIIPAPQTESAGLVSFSGYEYCRAVVDDFGDPSIHDEVLCWGSQLSKSNSLMMGVAWCIENDPCSFLWVLPNKELSESFSETRWIPIIDATPCLSKLRPVGKDRSKFKLAQQQIGGSQINFAGSNSPANLSSRPVRRAILDETDKFDMGNGEEADALNLAEQRTKAFSQPQRFKTSTPTLTTGLIWQEFLKGDQCRYWVPCPHCERFVILCWSPAYNTFKKTGSEAFAVWDKEAKRDNGWDMDRVVASARFICPHCAGHIQDGHKFKMIPRGQWRASVTNASAHFKSRHLPSLYGTRPENSIGRIAMKFLQAKKSILGLQGFINGDLAEPYQSQDTMQDRIEIITESSSVENPSGVAKLLTIDCQEVAPFFWYVVRSWSADATVGLEAGHVDTWEELRAIQLKHKIPDTGVTPDSGFGAKSDAEVYGNCARFGSWHQNDDGKMLALGWTPSKGMPSRKRWRHHSGMILPWCLGTVDPYAKTSSEGSAIMSLFEFSGDYFKDILASFRAGKFTPQWSISKDLDKEWYWHQMDSEIKKAVFNKRTGFTTHEWRKRSHTWPNHIMDCEVLQIAFACFHGLIDLEKVWSRKERTENEKN